MDDAFVLLACVFIKVTETDERTVCSVEWTEERSSTFGIRVTCNGRYRAVHQHHLAKLGLIPSRYYYHLISRFRTEKKKAS